MFPDKLSFHGFKERLDVTIVAIFFTTHRRFEVMLAQNLVVIVGAILAATIVAMDAAFVWCSEGYGHLLCTDRKIAFHPIAAGPSDETFHTLGMGFEGIEIGHVVSSADMHREGLTRAASSHDPWER